MNPFQIADRRSPRRAGWSGGVVLLVLMLVAPAPAWGQLSEVLVESNVSNATVVIDGTELARTNEDGVALIEAIAPGQHTVELRKAGYWNASVRVTLEPGLTTPVVLELRRREGSDVGNLLVETNVSGAIVELDGEEVGQTSPTGQIFISGVEPGQHQIVTRKEGYEPVSRVVRIDETGLDQTTRLQMAEVSEGDPTVSSSDDEPAPTITAGQEIPDSIGASFPTGGTVSTRQPAVIVNAEVEGASVRVNDSVFGQTGPGGRLRVRVDTGQHQISVSKEGLPPAQAQETVQVGVGEEQTLTLNLKQLDSRRIAGTEIVLILSLIGLSMIVVLFVVLISKPGGTLARWARKQLGVTRRVQYALAQWVRHPFQDRQPFDRYYVVQELRSGEFATIYLADDPEMRRRVRLRVLDTPYAGQSDHAESFLEGGRLLEHLQETVPDAPIATAYRCGRENGTEDGRPFLALEHFQGKTLASRMGDEGALAVDDALAIIRQVCVGLQAAHKNGVTHGHLTPANVVITQEDPELEIKLTGFGDREYKHTTEILTDGYSEGITSYLSPEEFEDGRSTWQSDMYSVGVLFYKMVTGSPPFTHENPVRIVEMHQEAPTPDLPERVPSTIRPVFYRLLNKDPDRRPTAKNVLSVLDLMGDLMEATT